MMKRKTITRRKGKRREMNAEKGNMLVTGEKIYVIHNIILTNLVKINYI